MSRRAVGQTKIMATAPLAEEVQRFDGRDPGLSVTVHLVVDSAVYRKAEPRAHADLQTLMTAAVRRRGGDPEKIVWSAEPIGPQIELATVNGRTL